MYLPNAAAGASRFVCGDFFYLTSAAPEWPPALNTFNMYLASAEMLPLGRLEWFVGITSTQQVCRAARRVAARVAAVAAVAELS